MNLLFNPSQWPPGGREAAGILLDAGLKSVAVLAVAGVVVAALRRRSAAARHLVCFLAVAGLPVLPLLSWMLPGWRVLPAWMDLPKAAPAVVQPAAPAPAPAKSLKGMGSAPAPGAVFRAPAENTVPTEKSGPDAELSPNELPLSSSIPPAPLPAAPLPHAPLNGWRMALYLWLAGVLVSLMPTLLGLMSLYRLERAARRETAATWLELLGRWLARLGFKRRIHLLKTERRRMPMTWGVVRPKVLLPEEAEQWPADRRSVVLLHELAHAQRCDYLTHLIARLICALYWFNPLVWLAARRMVTERERACDDIVLHHGAEPADYAEQVLEISAGLSCGWLAGGAGVAMARPSNLESRLRAILDASCNRAALTRAALISALVLLAIILVPVAMMKAAPSNPATSAAAGDADTRMIATNVDRFFFDHGKVEWEPQIQQVASFGDRAVPILTARLDREKYGQFFAAFDPNGYNRFRQLPPANQQTEFSDDGAKLVACLCRINTESSLKPVRALLQDTSHDQDLVGNPYPYSDAVVWRRQEVLLAFRTYPANRLAEVLPQLNRYSDPAFASISLAATERLREYQAATNSPATWGEAVEGLSVRLSAAGPSWDFREPDFFHFSVRNQGQGSYFVARTQATGELEMDGLWYQWSQPVDVKSASLLPGGHFDDLEVTLGHGEWRRGKDVCWPGVGQHTLRFAVSAQPQNGGPLIRVVSNPLALDCHWTARGTNVDTYVLPGPGDLNTLVNIEGRVVDDETGLAVTNFTPQMGVAKTNHPEEINWSLNLSGRSMGGDGRFSLQGQKAGQVWRILADGYLPQMVLDQPLMETNPATPTSDNSLLNKYKFPASNIQYKYGVMDTTPSNPLVVRLKRGGELHGVVRDDAGRPVADARVVIHRIEGGEAFNVFPNLRGVGDNTAITDAAGRFTLRGVEATVQTVEVTSPDGQMSLTARQSAPGAEMTLTLPAPATLTVRYDIPGDTDTATLSLIRGDGFTQSPVVTNHGQIVLTNLSAGAYGFRRERSLQAGYGGIWPSDRRTVVLEAGQSLAVNLVRTNGQRLRGQVTGLDKTRAAAGSLFIRSAEDTNALNWLPVIFDARTFDTNGQFQTALLEPGTYAVLATVYEPETNTSVMTTAIRGPDYTALTTVTITATNELPPMILELHPTAAGAPSSPRSAPARPAGTNAAPKSASAGQPLGDVAVATGGGATVAVTATGTPPISYQWTFNGTNVDGATLTLTNVPAGVGSYNVLTVTNSGTATFAVGPTGAQPISYQWYKNGVNLDGSTNSVLTLTNAPAGSGATTNAVNETGYYGVSLFSDLIVAGQITSEGRAVARVGSTSGEMINYYYYTFKIAEVLKGTPPAGETMEVAVVGSGRGDDAAFLKPGDNRILFLESPGQGRSAWLVASRWDGVLPMNPAQLASVKRFIKDGPEPPFSAWRTEPRLPPSTLDVRISAMTNVIAAAPKKLTNGRTDVLELPIRIENDSTQTVSASIGHEWFGGIWPPTDLGATVMQVDEPGRWRTSQVYLSGELGTETEPTLWQPGQSHTFVLRMNWPGTGSKQGGMLIDANVPGDYLVRVSLAFKSGANSEYVASPPMKITVREKSLAEAELNDDALRSYLGQSDLVVAGELVPDNRRGFGPDLFKVGDVIKGDPQTNIIRVGDDRGWPGPNVIYPNGKMVLFLWQRQVRGQTNLESFWRPRDVSFGALPETPTLVAALKRLAAVQSAKSGEAQLAALMQQFLPDATIREHPYQMGGQTFSSAELVFRGSVLDRREMKWVVEAPASNNITFMHCPKLTEAIWEYANVQTAQDAEAYVKLIFGLCAGPRALERWTVKAEPHGESWLVTPTYVGPPAAVRAVGPMELVYMNRAAGKVMDLREWRPNFKPGQTAKELRPDLLNPDGLDPAPAELDDPTLDYYLSRCEMVVVGKWMQEEDSGVIFSTGTGDHQFGPFNVLESIKGTAAPGSTLHVDVGSRSFQLLMKLMKGPSLLRKGEQLVLFLDYRGGISGTGTNYSQVWTTDDVDFGALPSSPALVAGLKRVAAAHGTALETPNLYWGAETNGVSVRLQPGRGGSYWKLGRNYELDLLVENRSSQPFGVTTNLLAGEVEVDGVWYSSPEASEWFDLSPPYLGGANGPITVKVGHRWRTETRGPDSSAGALLKLAPGKHTLRFAVTARPQPAAGAVRAVSNPIEVEIVPDTLNYRPQASSPFIYENNLGEIYIDQYNGPGGAVTIPDTLGGLPVACITGFGACDTVESITIPDSVTEIDESAFGGCSSLENVTLSKRIPGIVDGTFAGCSSLTQVTLPNSVTRIGGRAFWDCESLTEITIPAGVTNIGDVAFQHCPLKEIHFNGNAPALGKDVFDQDHPATVYYWQGTTGWGATFGGLPTHEMPTNTPAWVRYITTIGRPPVSQVVTNTPTKMIIGRVVDAETGRTITNFMTVMREVNLAKPEEYNWIVKGIQRVPGAEGRVAFPAERASQEWRILVSGYVPGRLPEAPDTNQGDLVIRLQRGAEFRGVVRDEAGRPLAGARVLLATVRPVVRRRLEDGSYQDLSFQMSTNTDMAGRFALPGEGGPAQRVVVVSPDNQQVWSAVQAGTGQEMDIMRPRPGTLILRYDIPGDAPAAMVSLNLLETNHAPEIGHGLVVGQGLTLNNDRELALTNLSPGTYEFIRLKSIGGQYLETERRRVQIEAGQTAHLDMVRTNGQRVRGKVTGSEPALVAGGVLFIRSAEATGTPWPENSPNEQQEKRLPGYDLMTFGADGTLETVMLQPGTYTFVADVYPPPAYSGAARIHRRNPDYVGVAKVTVTTGPMPPVTVKLEPAAFADLAGSVVDDEYNTPIDNARIQHGTVNPEQPGEMVWSEGSEGTWPGTDVQPGEFWLPGVPAGTALRFSAPGYAPQTLWRDEVLAARQTTHLQVRLKRGI